MREWIRKFWNLRIAPSAYSYFFGYDGFAIEVVEITTNQMFLSGVFYGWVYLKHDLQWDL